MDGFKYMKKGNRFVCQFLNESKPVTIVIGSKLYPVVSERIDCFHKDNCKPLDNNIAKQVDMLTPQIRIGRCFDNAKLIYNSLSEYDVKLYSGWLFMSDYDFPIFHSWILCGDSIIDPSTFSYGFFRNVRNRKNAIDILAKICKMPISKRVSCFGVPEPSVMYFGCETTYEETKELYESWIAAYPSHETLHKSTNGYTAVQHELQRRGIR